MTPRLVQQWDATICEVVGRASREDGRASRAPAHTEDCPGDGGGGGSVPEVLLIRAREGYGALQGGAQAEVGGQRAGPARRASADGPGRAGEAAAAAAEEAPEQAEDGAARQARREPQAQGVDEVVTVVWDRRVVWLLLAHRAPAGGGSLSLAAAVQDRFRSELQVVILYAVSRKIGRLAFIITVYALINKLIYI